MGGKKERKKQTKNTFLAALKIEATGVLLDDVRPLHTTYRPNTMSSPLSRDAEHDALTLQAAMRAIIRRLRGKPAVLPLSPEP
jgi:hypothetical protein